MKEMKIYMEWNSQKDAIESLQKAERYLDQRQLTLAKFFFTDAVKLNSENAYACGKELETVFMLGQKQQSLKLIEKMKVKFPEEYYPWHMEYLILATENEEKVKKLLESAEGKFSKNSYYQYDKFIFYVGMEYYTEAVKIAENNLIADDEMLVKVVDELSDVYVLLGDVDRAISILEKAQTIDNNVLFIVKLIQYRLMKGENKEIEKLCEMLPDNNYFAQVFKIIINTIIYNDKEEKKLEINNAIMLCKSSKAEYPYRMCLDLLCAVLYYMVGEIENALEILEYIEVLSDKRIKEVSDLKKTISANCINDNDNESLCFSTYVWDAALKVFVQYIRGDISDGKIRY